MISCRRLVRFVGLSAASHHFVMVISPAALLLVAQRPDLASTFSVPGIIALSAAGVAWFRLAVGAWGRAATLAPAVSDPRRPRP